MSEINRNNPPTNNQADGGNPPAGAVPQATQFQSQQGDQPQDPQLPATQPTPFQKDNVVPVATDNNVAQSAAPVSSVQPSTSPASTAPPTASLAPTTAAGSSAPVNPPPVGVAPGSTAPADDPLLTDKQYPEDLDARWTSWKCIVCNYFYEGQKSINVCPRCNNSDPDKFD